VIEHWLPRKFDLKSLERLCGPARYEYDVDSATSAVAQPMWDILDRGGKRWRPVLLILVAQALGASVEDVKDLVVICEVVHNGTLLVDDIEDNSDMRRGKKSIHLIYGTDVAINAGNAMYYLPTVILRELRGKVPAEKLVQAYETYCEEMINLHFGQGLDICWHNGGASPTVSQYLQMCAYKTGTLARMSAKLSAVFAGGSEEQIEKLSQFAETIGVAFQIQDDILNLVGDKLASTKGQYGEDIHEGKRTLMVLHCLHNAPQEQATRLLDILNQHPQDQKIIDEAIDIIKKNGSIEYAKEKAQELVKHAWKEVEAVISDSPAKQKLKAFADFLVERDI